MITQLETFEGICDFLTRASFVLIQNKLLFDTEYGQAIVLFLYDDWLNWLVISLYIFSDDSSNGCCFAARLHSTV